MNSNFLIAAPSSNSGKTTITLGLLRLLYKKGLIVQPFKCGPDYIDPKHHTHAAYNPSINLDTYMMSNAHVQELFNNYSSDANVSIVEGVMGLFDGANKMNGSSAEIALLLNLPIVLIINAKAIAYSVAPLLYGFKNFNANLKMIGVIFNLVNTESHYQILKEACEDVGIECLGYLPPNENIKIPSRYLGLAINNEIDYEYIIEQAALHIEKTVDINRLLELTKVPHIHEKSTNTISKKKLNITVAQDDAFNFTYHLNKITLEKIGNVTYFSPINDNQIPTTDLLYLSGGYPELFLKELESNAPMLESIRNYCKNGGKVIAECGGMMYLGKVIID